MPVADHQSSTLEDERMSSKVDVRRMAVKTGSSMILHLSGIALFSEAYGYGGVIRYILVLVLARWIFLEGVSRLVSRYPNVGPTIYQLSGLSLALVAIPVLVVQESAFSLYSIPVLVALFVATHWGLYFEISETQGQDTEGYDRTEVFASFLSAVLVVLVSLRYSIEYAAALGALISLLVSFKRVDVTPEDFQAAQDEWRLEANSRERKSVLNGYLIVISISAMTLSSLSLIRIHAFGTTESIVDGVIELGVVLAVAELVTYLVKNYFKVPYDSQWFSNLSFVTTLVGFLAMTQWFGDTWLLPYIGYLIVTTNSRGFFRTADREFARAALRGIGELPGLRELTRYRAAAILVPLVLVPNILPYIGIIFAIVFRFMTVLRLPEYASHQTADPSSDQRH
uniref:Uncharacterized protein n=1 Tax=uncultured marine group II/III euryarchaeote SAT1000_51_D10 TaxID=1456587 RepID=A0A075I9Y5_9EURY|nr:hypothetical protein [uncultured marine group II/III euryarchaeote SAT1000_51_D10]